MQVYCCTLPAVVVVVLTSLQCILSQFTHPALCEGQYKKAMEDYVTTALGTNTSGGDQIQYLKVWDDAYDTCFFAINVAMSQTDVKQVCSSMHKQGKIPVASETLLKCLSRTLMQREYQAYFVYTLLDNDQLSELKTFVNFSCKPPDVYKPPYNWNQTQEPSFQMKGQRVEENTHGVPLKLLTLINIRGVKANEVWKIEPYDEKNHLGLCQLPTPIISTTVSTPSTTPSTPVPNNTSTDTSADTSVQQSPTKVTSPSPVAATSASTVQRAASTKTDAGPEAAKNIPTVQTSARLDFSKLYLALGVLAVLVFVLLVVGVVVALVFGRRKRRRTETVSTDKVDTGAGSPEVASTRSFSTPTGTESISNSVRSAEQAVGTGAKIPPLKVSDHGAINQTKIASPKRASSEFSTPMASPPHYPRQYDTASSGAASSGEKSFSSRLPDSDS